MFDQDDIDDALYEFNARHDYRREAYGDPCPGCGTLRWQGDCPTCTRPDDEDEDEAFARRAGY